MVLPAPVIVSQRRVVVTGLGAVTPLACGIQASWERLLQGKSGIKRLRPSSEEDTGYYKVVPSAGLIRNHDDATPYNAGSIRQKGKVV